jgi:cyclophilin family peptidyl-prolyl cis-trans isomerase
LREETYVALLSLAEGDATNKPVGEALYPLGRVEHLTPSVVERTREVASTLLAKKGPARVYAVAALGRCDEAAVPQLREVLDKKDAFSAAERVEAARALARFGGDGQKALAAALDTMVPDTSPVAATTLVGPDTAVLLTVLDQLTVVRGAQAALDRIAKLPPPPEAPAAVTLRLSWLRCRAAQLLAERTFDSPLLRGCDLGVPADKQSVDPLPSSVGARAIVSAIGIDAVKIEGKRHQAWRAYALEGELRSRQAALSQIVEHAEIRDATEVLTKALEAEEPGLVATAAEVIAKTPQRAFEPKGKGKDDEPRKVVAPLAKALLARLEPAGPTADLEALSAIIDAVAALALPEAKEPLTKLCASPYGVVRERVAKALASIEGKAAPACNTVTPLPPPLELDRLIGEPATIKLETDVGELELTVDPTLAPVAATRALDLAKNGFYDSMVVHRVVPGFVSQFGSPTADGYGGVKGLAPLPCETSPLPFGPLTVGVALAGRDTGSSQLFVTHQAIPRLDGQYALVGTAKGPWDQLIDGDVIRKAKVEGGGP